MVHLLKHLRILVAGIVLISAAFSAAMVDRARAQDAPAEETGVPLADYVSALREAQDILSHGGQPSAVDQARAALAGIDRIELAGGAEITVAPLLGVEGAALTQDAAAARVGILLAQLDAAGSDNTSGRLAVLDQVLARPAFQQGESWWEVFRRWLAEWLARLLPDAAPSSSNAGAAGRANELIIWSIGIVGIAAIVLLLAYWLRGLIAGVVANADGDEAGGNEDDLPQSPAEARQRAAGAANAGNYRGAVRNLYLAALLTLEQQGLVPADRSLTNREVLGRVGSTHPLRPHLQPVVETFDDVWYGVHEPDAGTYTAYTHAIDELEMIAQQGGAQQAPKEVRP
jgi:hypothetical protein